MDGLMDRKRKGQTETIKKNRQTYNQKEGNKHTLETQGEEGIVMT
jgi:hypothetical protein